MSIACNKTIALCLAGMLGIGATGFSSVLQAQEAQEPTPDAAQEPAPESSVDENAESSAASPDAAEPQTATESPEDSAQPPPAEVSSELQPEPASDSQLATIPVESSEPAPELNADGDSVALDEIVVTARKRQESIQEVPLSVTAFNAKDMEQRGYSGLEDIAAATPGFTFEPYMTGGAHGAPVIRGLAQTFTTARIQNVSFFLDGVYLQRQSMLNLGLVDMERIEVVKGPQNALYGRNAFAGAVNYVTLAPNDKVEGYLTVGSGDNQRSEYRASISGPLTESGIFKGKLTAGITSYDGHTKNNHPVADADPAGPNLRGNLGGGDDATYSASLLFEPNDRLSMRGSFYRSEIEHETGAGYSISGVGAARFGLRFNNQNDLNCNIATVNNIQPQPPRTHTGFTAWCGELPRYASDVAPRKGKGIIVDPRAIGTITETDAMTLSTQYQINDVLSVNYLYGFADHTSYTDGGASDEDPLAGRGIVSDALTASASEAENQNPDNYNFANTASGRPNSELKSFSHELRFDWQTTEHLRTSFGAYYSGVKDAEWTSLFINDLCNADNAQNIRNCNTPLSAPNTLAERTVITAGVAYDQYVRQHGGKLRGEWTAFDETIKAVFSSASYEFNDQLEGTLEARYTVEDKAVERLTDSFMLAPGESVTYNPPEDPVLPFGNTVTSNITIPKDDVRFTNFTPRAILNWNYADHHMVYASVAKGVKTGGFNNANSEAELTFDQESNWTYELGSKNSFLHRSITINGAVYYVDWTGLQGGIPPTVAGLSTSDIVTNIGGAQSIGVELESVVRFNDAISIDLGGAYNKATYADGTKYAAGRQATGSFHCNGVVCPVDGDISGNQLARTARQQFSAGLNFDTYLAGWTMGARLDTNYQSKQYVDPLNLAWVPERRLTNTSLRFVSPSQQWEVSGWAKNITNEDYAANSFLIGVFNQYMVGKGAGRTFGANLKYKF